MHLPNVWIFLTTSDLTRISVVVMGRPGHCITILTTEPPGEAWLPCGGHSRKYFLCLFLVTFGLCSLISRDGHVAQRQVTCNQSSPYCVASPEMDQREKTGVTSSIPNAFFQECLREKAAESRECSGAGVSA